MPRVCREGARTSRAGGGPGVAAAGETSSCRAPPACGGKRQRVRGPRAFCSPGSWQDGRSLSLHAGWTAASILAAPLCQSHPRGGRGWLEGGEAWGVTPVSEYLRLKAPWEWRCPICLRPALADAMAGWARRFVGFFASLGASILCHTWPDTPLSPGDRPPRLQSWIRLRAGVGAVPLRRSRGGGRCWGWAAASLWEEQTEAGCGYGDQPGPGLSPAADQQGWPPPLGSLVSRLLLPTLSTRPTSGAGL